MMKSRLSLICAAASLALLVAAPAFAGSTVLLTDKNGQLSFPISPPNRSTGAAGALDNTSIGATTPAPVVASKLSLDSGTKTASATAGAATLNKNAGVITSEALVTAAGASYTLTLTDNTIAVGDQVFASAQLGTSTQGSPAITAVTPGAGQVVIVVQNIHATLAFNGTIKVSFAHLAN